MSAALVSIIIRSTDRQGLGTTLKSVAAQSYANIEIIVVDAAGRSPHLPAHIEWQAGHTIRQLSNAQRLRQPQAANIGIAAVRGDFFCFLDDNSRYEPHHVEALVSAANLHPETLLLYTRSRTMTNDGAAGKTFGRLFNRALFHFDPLFHLQAALIHRRAIELGCRFDESLDVGDEHDFLKQIAAHGDFVFLPHTPPVFKFLPDGVAPGGDIGIAQRAYSENLKLAKWAGERHYHTLRSSLVCARAAELLHAGRLAQARAAFEEILNAYPDDPDALHGMANCDLAAGHLDAATRHIFGAIDLDPENAAYHHTARLIHARLADIQPRQPAASSAITSASAESPLQFLPAQHMAAQPSLALRITAMTAAPRMALCACGSGKRYKHCCGRLIEDASADTNGASNPSSPSAEVVVRRAQRLLQSGEADAAAALLEQLEPKQMRTARIAKIAGEALLKMHRLETALALLERAVELGAGHDQALAAYNECCTLMLRATAWRSASRTLQALYNRLNARASSRHAQAATHIHIVCKLDSIGGTERRALNLQRCLSAHASVTLWSTVPALAQYCADFAIRRITPDDVPFGGSLVLIGTYFDCGEWLEKSPFDNIIICHNLAEQYPSLMERLIQIEENRSRPSVKLTFPSKLFRDTVGLPGLVEYSALELDVFRRRGTRIADSARLTVGRHGRAYALKFHPNDPAFFRRLIARGYKIRVLGGTTIAPMFADDTGPVPELLAIEQEQPRDFLESLDVFIYRKHPKLFETGGSTIIEAMAMELPVIVFPEQCGAAELIVHGQNGFLVDSEDEAIELLDRLAADHTLRERIGHAARTTIVELLSRQQPRVVAHYLGLPEQAMDQQQMHLSL